MCSRALLCDLPLSAATPSALQPRLPRSHLPNQQILTYGVRATQSLQHCMGRAGRRPPGAWDESELWAERLADQIADYDGYDGCSYSRIGPW